MQAWRAGRTQQIFGIGALALIAAVVQGIAVFWFFDLSGPWFSRAGLTCLLIPAGVELVVFIVSMKALDELHARSVSNLHSLLGEALRGDRGQPPAPPPTRAAWDGGFEDISRAADKMAKDR